MQNVRELKTKADSTLRSSQAVPHPSTDRALRCLTSEVKRDPVHSTRYGRRRLEGRSSKLKTSQQLNCKKTKKQALGECRPNLGRLIWAGAQVRPELCHFCFSIFSRLSWLWFGFLIQAVTAQFGMSSICWQVWFRMLCFASDAALMVAFCECRSMHSCIRFVHKFLCLVLHVSKLVLIYLYTSSECGYAHVYCTFILKFAMFMTCDSSNV